LFVLGTALLLALCAKKLYGRVAAWAAPALFIALMATPIVFPYAANTEKFMLLPMTGALCIYLYAEAATARRGWFWAGFLSALALLFKPICLFVLVLLHAAWAFEIWRKNKTELPWHGLLVLAGGAAATALCCGYIILRGAWPQFWELNVTFNSQLAVLFGANLSALKNHLLDLARYWWLTGLLCAGSVFKKNPRKPLLWGLLGCAFAAAYRDINGHYYILLLPFMALIAAGALVRLGKTAAAFLCASAMLANVAPMATQLGLSPDQLTRRIYTGNPFTESAEMARQLDRYTAPDDEVFIAGSEPQILYYAKRRSATRFVIMYPLMYATPSARKYQTQAIDELSGKTPRAIVVARVGTSWAGGDQTPPLFIPFFTDYIRKYEFTGGCVTENGKTVWKTGRENEQAVLLALYLRKPQ
ncbi:MAG: hypothetical protein PHW69_09690, partial [Elusimicrobiaceae bacterium]|nr:hypothetical protein [Elusimicrobiaceae bacterium]